MPPRPSLLPTPMACDGTCTCNVWCVYMYYTCTCTSSWMTLQCMACTVHVLYVHIPSFVHLPLLFLCFSDTSPPSLSQALSLHTTLPPRPPPADSIPMPRGGLTSHSADLGSHRPPPVDTSPHPSPAPTLPAHTALSPPSSGGSAAKGSRLTIGGVLRAIGGKSKARQLA